MSELLRLQQEIEYVRIRLHDLVEKKAGQFIDPEVTELSAYLDQLILKYERSKMYLAK